MTISPDRRPYSTRTEDAQILVGKTIASALVQSHDPSCDAENTLVLTMTDGSVIDVVGGYGGYTGRSCDEYKELIHVQEKGSYEDGQP